MKEQTVNRSKRIICRLKPDEYAKIERRWKESTCRKLSDYVRRMLFNKPIVTTYRNRSLDDFMAEMIQLRNELNSIGNNFNQAVKKLHTLHQIAGFKSWITTYEADKNRLLNKVDEIKNHIEIRRVLCYYI